MLVVSRELRALLNQRAPRARDVVYTQFVKRNVIIEREFVAEISLNFFLLQPSYAVYCYFIVEQNFLDEGECLYPVICFVRGQAEFVDVLCF